MGAHRWRAKRNWQTLPPRTAALRINRLADLLRTKKRVNFLQIAPETMPVPEEVEA
jgi:hypothetical protein